MSLKIMRELGIITQNRAQMFKQAEEEQQLDAEKYDKVYTFDNQLDAIYYTSGLAESPLDLVSSLTGA